MDTIWNASILKHDEDIYYIKNAGWNQDIRPDEMVEFEFTSKSPYVQTVPSSYEVLESRNLVPEMLYQGSAHYTKNWESGYQGTVIITNNQQRTLEDWVLEFDYDGTITQFFEADIKSHTGNHYIIENAGYNGNLAPEETVEIRDEEDYDKDKLSNLEEYQLGTDSGLSDTDGDGLSDYIEWKVTHTDPLAYDTDQDGLGDGTERLNHFNPLKADTDGNGTLDGKERIFNQKLTEEVYRELDYDTLGVKPSITVTGTGDYSRQIRLEQESYHGIYSELDYLVSPVIHFAHNKDMQYEKARISFTIGEEIRKNYSLSNLSIVRLEDGGVIPVESQVDKERNTVWAEVDELCEYAVEDRKSRTTPKHRQNEVIGDLEFVYVIGLSAEYEIYRHSSTQFLYEIDQSWKQSYYNTDFNLSEKAVTYSDYKDEMTLYGRGNEENPYCTAGILSKCLRYEFEIEKNQKEKKPENQIKALELACSQFTSQTSKKVLVLIHDRGKDWEEHEDPSLEAFKEKLLKDTSIHFWETACYENKPDYGGYWYRMKFLLNEKEADTEEEYSFLNQQLPRGELWAGDMDMDCSNIFNEYLSVLTCQKREKEIEENATTVLVRLSDYQFVRISTDPEKDTDGDGIPDQTELGHRRELHGIS